jgi:hypothetical protein
MRRSIAIRALVVAALAAVALGASSGANAAAHKHANLELVQNPAGSFGPRGTFAHPHLGATHWFGRGRYGWWGRSKAELRARTPRLLAPLDLLTNHGPGEIMPTTNTHLIFWLPSGFHYEGNSAGDLAYEAAMQKFFQDVGGSQILNTTTQYPGTNGTPSDTSTYKDSVVDTTAYPHAGTVADPVTQGDLNQEVYNQILANGWPTGLSDMYFVFLPDNLVDCDNSLVNCNTNAYCAYHTRGWGTTDTPANDFIWADIPVNRGVNTLGGCGNSTVTGDNEADTTLSSVEHELEEAITDPRGNAWQDSTGGGGENGDKCNRNMGVANSGSTAVNNFLGFGGGDKFRIQREWSNAAALGGPSQNGCAASYTTSGSGVVAPSPSGGDVTASVTESTIEGDNGDVLHYHVGFHNPSDQDDAYSIGDSAAYATGVTGSGSTGLGDLSPQLTANGNLTASITGGPLLDGTVLTSTFTTSFDDSTGTAQPTIQRTATTTVVNAQPTLTVPGPQSQDYRDSLTFGISTTDPNPGDTVSLSASGLPAGLALTDNGDGTGTVSGTITADPGVYTATFSADDHHHLTPVTQTVQITVTKEETATTYTGPTVIAQGFPVTLQAQLLEDGTTAPSPSGQTLTLSLGVQSCTATVDSSGNASCPIGPVSAPLGTTIPLNAAFGGDAHYLASFDNSKQAIVFGFPTRGAFALGDLTVGSAGPSSLLTWWSSDWSTLNQLSGGPVTTAFKGFVGAPAPSAPPACSGTWTTGPGNSPPPVGTIPSYMGVLVPSSVQAQGSKISGNTPKIVVVKTNPGYAPSPGHPGTGTYVATYCG